jgi:diguanylate cyclase (GGDEF)-like protein
MNGDGAGDSRRDLLQSWNERCRSSAADGGPCSGPDAVFLVSALSSALRRGSQTPELGRAARSWGAHFTAPVEALSALSALREVVLEASRVPGVVTPRGEPPVAAQTINKVMDQLMLEAVDAASVNLRVQARTDPLTGCANRLALSEDLAHAANSATRSGLDIALAEVDLDGLKRINDTRGHAAGDAALKALVTRLRSALRDADTLYRTGGDEFVVVAPFTDASGAAAMLQRALETNGPRFSWGVASMRAIGQAAIEDPELLVIAADTDLYARRRSARELPADAADKEAEKSGDKKPTKQWATRALMERATVPALAVLGASMKRSRVTLASARASAFSGARHQSLVVAGAATSAVAAARRHRRTAASAVACLVLLVAISLGLAVALGQGVTTPNRSALGSPSGSGAPAGSGQSNPGSGSSPSTPSSTGAPGGATSNSGGGDRSGTPGSTSVGSTVPSSSSAGGSAVSRGSTKPTLGTSSTQGSSGNSGTSGSSGPSGTSPGTSGSPSGLSNSSGSPSSQEKTGTPSSPSSQSAGSESPLTASPSGSGPTGVTASPAATSSSASSSSASSTSGASESVQLSEAQVAEVLEALKADQVAEAAKAAESDAAVDDEEAVAALKEVQDHEALVNAEATRALEISAAVKATESQEALVNAEATAALEISAAVKDLETKQSFYTSFNSELLFLGTGIPPTATKTVDPPSQTTGQNAQPPTSNTSGSSTTESGPAETKEPLTPAPAGESSGSPASGPTTVVPTDTTTPSDTTAPTAASQVSTGSQATVDTPATTRLPEPAADPTTGSIPRVSPSTSGTGTENHWSSSMTSSDMGHIAVGER